MHCQLYIKTVLKSQPAVGFMQAETCNCCVILITLHIIELYHTVQFTNFYYQCPQYNIAITLTILQHLVTYSKLSYLRQPTKYQRSVRVPTRVPHDAVCPCVVLLSQQIQTNNTELSRRINSVSRASRRLEDVSSSKCLLFRH